MKRRLLDILACPICKHHPLDLHVIRESDEINEGVLVCKSCNRWYPIINDIPHMLPDDMREPEEDLEFLERWKEKIPAEIVEKGKPFNLTLKK
ncbi:MAG: Trm112 family protein [Candidatus Methanosuratincola sp.]